VDGGDKIVKVREVAKLSGAVILLKGADMVVVALDKPGGGE
jgi:NAD(P)H-hydrate repair Nnr-like enzyme with NAD(P)H-hydrate dehydratase domain